MNRFRNLVDALEAASADRPFVTVWIDEDERETVTFEEFRERARLQANTLRNHGVTTGDRVVVIMPQGISAMTAFVGAMMLGAVPAFLAYPNFKVEPSKYRSGLAGVTANLSAKVVMIDEHFPDEMLPYVSLNDGTTLLHGSDATALGEQIELPGVDLQSDTTAFIQHSAGTTGLQKGVAQTHGAVLRQIEHLANALKLDSESDRIYSWLPLYHDMGLIACFMLPMVCHLDVVMKSPLDWVMHPETMLQIISEYKCTLAWMPNFAFQFVPRRTPQHRSAQYDLSFVRALINCSEPVRASSMWEFQSAFGAIGLKLRHPILLCDGRERFRGNPSGYRSVPSPSLGGRSGVSCEALDCSSCRRDLRIHFISIIGSALPDHELRIVSDSGEQLDHLHVGEILIKSDCLFEGYYNRPDLTVGAIIEGWYHTGDLGFCFKDELFVVGRKKDLIIVGGENLYPQDIEEIVAGHPAIHDGRVVAMGMFNPDLGTDDIVVVAEVERQALLTDSAVIETELRNRVVAGIGVAVRTIFMNLQSGL